MVKNLRDTYQIKVTLKGIKPPIWRRLLVPSSLNLYDFHFVLQVVMGWTNSHLHAFVCHGIIYSLPEPDADYAVDETKVKLSSLLKKTGDKLRYDYDFGDNWEHDVVLEKILPYTHEQSLPVCLKGKRACPPEDCGGIWGYKELLQIISNPQHEDYEELMEWLQVEFDPEYVDIDEINNIFHKQTRLS